MQIKRLNLCVFLTVAVLPSQAYGDWSKQEVIAEAAWHILHVIDWGQTRAATRDPRFEEGYGPLCLIIGHRPDVQTVDMAMGTMTILHPLITQWLPRTTTVAGMRIRPRDIWQHVTIGITAGYVAHNASIGVKWQW